MSKKKLNDSQQEAAGFRGHRYVEVEQKRDKRVDHKGVMDPGGSPSLCGPEMWTNKWADIPEV